MLGGMISLPPYLLSRRCYFRCMVYGFTDTSGGAILAGVGITHPVLSGRRPDQEAVGISGSWYTIHGSSTLMSCRLTSRFVIGVCEVFLPLVAAVADGVDRLAPRLPAPSLFLSGKAVFEGAAAPLLSPHCFHLSHLS